MNWLEKIDYLIEKKKRSKPNDIYFYDVTYRDENWQPNELEKIVQSYKYLPKYYINFIHKYDSISLSFVRFFGSQINDINVLSYEIDRCKSLLKDRYFPFGYYADGSVFMFNKKSNVVWWDKYDYDFEEKPRFLAETFEKFIDECLLGKRYGEFSNTDSKDGFANFLRSEGWL